MTRVPKLVLIVACLLSFLLLLGTFNESKPRILVLHSGQQDSPWVREVDRGMREALAANRRPVSVEWDYLDISAPGADQRVQQAQARRAIGRIDPAVLIAVDDEANLLVARDYVGRVQPRIFYVSLDRPPADYGYVGAPNVSGIAERLPFAAIKDAITAMNPGVTPGVSIIGVDNVTGRAEMAQAQSFDWGSVKVDAAQMVSTAEAWRQFVMDASGSEFLVVLSCQSLPDRDGAVFSAADASRWTQANSRALPIGTNVDFVENGGALSISPDADDYGRTAIRLALDWLDDRASPGPPPPVESSHFAVSIRTEALKSRGVTLPPIYVEAARENGTLLG
ncbi:MAG: hypothetical protein K8R24_15855 [Mycobacterium sp.]|nr:hypothetical protein [Mycobacterium sp.]